MTGPVSMKLISPEVLETELTMKRAMNRGEEADLPTASVGAD
jgi:hypothetical protein